MRGFIAEATIDSPFSLHIGKPGEIPTIDRNLITVDAVPTSHVTLVWDQSCNPLLAKFFQPCVETIS